MPHDLIREIPVIAKRAAANEEEDFRFRAYLKGHSMSGARLDARVREITDDVWSQIDCTTCANCCRAYTTSVDDVDIARLAKRLEITTAEFGKRYIDGVIDGEKQLISKPCVFLGDDNRCTVYDDRPKVCRDFPYLHKEDFVFRLLMMIENTSACPIVYNVWDRLKDDLWNRRR